MPKEEKQRPISTELAILSLLNEKDMYGYEMSQLITERSKGILSLKEGALYVVLYRMVKDGTISDTQEVVGRRMRVYYHLEPAGIERLHEVKREYEMALEGMALFLKNCKQ